MLTPLEQHYAKHKEDLRLSRRHGIVEYSVTMMQIRRALAETGGRRILDVGAGTGRYASALRQEGYQVECVELVQHNIDVMLQRDPLLHAVKGDARHMPWVPNESQDMVLLLGPLYHLVREEDKQAAMLEARRVLRPGGVLLAGYLMNDYSILTYCFAEDRMEELMAMGFVDGDFHVRSAEDALYDYVRTEDMDRLNGLAGFSLLRRFSPEGAADFMRTPLNRMSERCFELFVQYQQHICERADLIGAGSHVTDVLLKQ